MSGVPFRLDGGPGRVLVSWMSRGQVYWTISRAGGNGFEPRVPAPRAADAGPAGSGKQNYPTAVANRKGEVLLVWKEGTQVRWASYDQRGRLLGKSGVCAEIAPESKPVALLGEDDRFRVVM